MTAPSRICFYLEPSLRESAAAGQHNFLGLIAAVGREAGLEIDFRDDAAETLRRSRPEDEFAVTHMAVPPHERAVTVRRSYAYPFWSIETSEKRWEFDVARATFDAALVDNGDARKFARFWRKRLTGDWPDVANRGHVYVPLQGRLLEQRSFQAASPIEMIKAVLEHEPDRAIAAGLHPKERYSAKEINALERLEQKHPRFSVQLGGMERLLPGCDYVVTQNSGAGFMGYFLAKPLVLFGRIDFHHIAARVDRLGVEGALRTVRDGAPEFDAYLWWFWQKMAINAGRQEAKEKIAARLRGFGWPV